MTDAEKKADMKKVNGIFEMKIKNSKGKEASWVIDMKKEGYAPLIRCSGWDRRERFGAVFADSERAGRVVSFTRDLSRAKPM